MRLSDRDVMDNLTDEMLRYYEQEKGELATDEEYSHIKNIALEAFDHLDALIDERTK